MTILAQLRADIDESLRTGAFKALLWLDPQRAWEPLLGKLSDGFQFRKYDGSQLKLRADLERQPADKPRIVYVPLSRKMLTVLKEYEFILPVWDETLLHALQRWGVGVEPDEERALTSLLPNLVARWSDKPMDYWRHLTATGVRARLFDDEQLRVFLADPDGIAGKLREEGTFEMFQDFLDEAFGVSPDPNASPAEVALRLVQMLILAEAFERSGPQTFPYQDRLPQPGARERCVRFLSRWLEARTQSQTASRLLREADGNLQLAAWATALETPPDVQGSLQVEHALVDRVEGDVRACTSLEERASLLADGLNLFRRQASHFWALEGEVPEWDGLALAGAVAGGAQEALAELRALQTAEVVVRAYVERWWNVDQAYRQYRAGFEAHPGLDEVADTVRRLHRLYLEETNKKFAQLLEGTKGLEATGLPEQRSFWPSGDIARRAVLILDAFRFELARELEAKIRDFGQISVDLRQMRTSLPSITPIGMASLLPLNGLVVTVSDGVWSIRAQDVEETIRGADLAAKEGRERLLKSRLHGYSSIDLRNLLDLPVQEVPRASWLMVYSTTLDEAGHGGVLSLTPRAAEDYVEQCARAIRKLAGAGVDEVHVVTDHGFFLLDEVSDHDVVQIKARGVEYKSHRAVVCREVASASLLTFPLIGSDLTVGVPRATGILEARGGYQFFHGGASLQEIIVPHLRAVFSRRPVKYGVRIQVPTRITSLLFDVELDAEPPTGQLSFAGIGPRFVEIRIHLLEEGAIVEPPLATATGSELFVSETQKRKRVRIRIPDGARFHYGDSIRIVARDADPPLEQLATAEAVVNVEPGF